MAEPRKTSRIIRQTATPCVGRDRELQRLQNRFAEASRSGQWVVVVKGPAGVGKSRLLEEFRSRMRLEGAVVVEGRCSPGMRALAPASQILHQAIDFLEQVGRAGDVDVSRFAALLGEVPGAPPSTRGLRPLDQRRQLFDAYVRLLRDLSRIKPLAVIVHDLHFADPASVELFTRLADAGAGMPAGGSRDQGIVGLVVASVRSGDEPEPLAELSEHPRVEIMTLAGFDREGLRAFLASDHVVDRLLDATFGNPESLEELVEAAYTLTTRGPRERVEALDPPGRMALATLWALGQPSEASLVARAGEIKSPATVLAGLIDEGLVSKAIQGREIVLSLARARYGELAYGWLDESERRALHLRIARLLSGAAGLEAQLLASHAILAGERDLAVSASLEAASALELNYAFEAAAELLELAAPMAEGGTRLEIDSRLARLYDHLGEERRALELFRAVASARPTDHAASLAVARLQARAGEIDEAARAIDELSSRPLEAGDEDLAVQVARARAEVWRARGREQLEAGDHEGARKTFAECRDLALAHDLDELRIAALAGLGLSSLSLGDLAEAQARFEEALALARRLGSRRHAALALENLAVVARSRGDVGAALEHCREAVADLKRYGDRPLVARAATSLGGLYLALGQVDRAAGLATMAEQMAGAEPGPELAAGVSLLKGRLALARGDKAAARAALEDAEDLAEEAPRAARAGVQLALAEVEVREGRLGPARRRIADLRAEGGLHQAELGGAAALEADIEEASAAGEGLRPALVAVDHYERARDLQGAWKAHLRVAELLRAKGDEQGFLRHVDRAAACQSELDATLPVELLEELANDEDRVRLRRAMVERAGRAAPVAAAEPEAAPVVLRTTVRRDEGAEAPTERDMGLVYRSAAMGRMLQLVRRVAPTESIVLIRGESGTGKELVAEAIHALSRRKDGPLVKVNCAAFVETLLLSELFGHEKGAFTGALRRREGRFEAADRGTLFLDEIGDISLATQVSLLRVLQEQRFERVGGTRPVETDARVLCATNRDLEGLVKTGTFRQDLYYRLKGIEIRIPPLRERPDDLEALAGHFLARACADHGMTPLALSQDALAALRGHDWPGNVRELENVIRTVVTFVDGPAITAEDLRRHARLGERVSAVPPPPPTPRPRPAEDGSHITAVSREILESPLSLAEAKKRLEREAAEEALRRTGGNITRAAELLGITRPRLSQMIKELGLNKP